MSGTALYDTQAFSPQPGPLPGAARLVGLFRAVGPWLPAAFQVTLSLLKQVLNVSLDLLLDELGAEHPQTGASLQRHVAHDAHVDPDDLQAASDRFELDVRRQWHLCRNLLDQHSVEARCVRWQQSTDCLTGYVVEFPLDIEDRLRRLGEQSTVGSTPTSRPQPPPTRPAKVVHNTIRDPIGDRGPESVGEHVRQQRRRCIGLPPSRMPRA